MLLWKFITCRVYNSLLLVPVPSQMIPPATTITPPHPFPPRFFEILLNVFWPRPETATVSVYHPKYYSILGAFAKLRKVTVSFVMSVCPSMSFRMEQLGFHWTDFQKIWNFNIFRKYVEKIHFSLKSDKKRGVTWRPLCTYDSLSLNSSSNEKCFRLKSYRELKHMFCIQ